MCCFELKQRGRDSLLLFHHLTTRDVPTPMCSSAVGVGRRQYGGCVAAAEMQQQWCAAQIGRSSGATRETCWISALSASLNIWSCSVVAVSCSTFAATCVYVCVCLCMRASAAQSVQICMDALGTSSPNASSSAFCESLAVASSATTASLASSSALAFAAPMCMRASANAPMEMSTCCPHTYACLQPEPLLPRAVLSQQSCAR